MTPLWPTGIEKKNEFGFRAAKKSNPAIERTILLHDKNKTVAVRTKSGRSQNRRNTVELWAAEPGRGECRQNGRRQGPPKWRRPPPFTARCNRIAASRLEFFFFWIWFTRNAPFLVRNHQNQIVWLLLFFLCVCVCPLLSVLSPDGRRVVSVGRRRRRGSGRAVMNGRRRLLLALGTRR